MKKTTREYISQYNMFSILAQQNNGERNAECIEQLYKATQQHEEGYDEESAYTVLERVIIAESSDEDDLIKTSRQRAKDLVKSMLDHGILVDTYRNQKRYLLFTESGNKLADVLFSLDNQQEREYSSDIDELMLVLTTDVAYEQPYNLVLTKIDRTTKQLIHDMRNLMSDLKSRIEEDTKDWSLDEFYSKLLEEHDDETGPFGKFNRLYQKIQNKHFMPFVADKLHRIQNSENMMEAAITECQRTNNLETRAEAEREVKMLIASLLNQYEGEKLFLTLLDKIQGDIRDYYNRANQKIQLATSKSSATTTDMLKYIYQHLDLLTETDSLSNMFNLFSITLYDPLRYSVHGKKIIQTRTEAVKKPSVAERKELVRKDQERRNRTSFSQANQKVRALLQNKNEISDKDFPLQSEDDVDLIVAAFTGRKNPQRCFDIQLLPGETENPFGTYSRFKITRRKNDE